MNDLDRLVAKLSLIQNPTDRLNRCREAVQVLYLSKLYEAGWFKHFAFMGGTCLRLCYKLARFSEDLDFVGLPGTKTNPKEMEGLLESANKRLVTSGLQVRTNKLKTSRNVWKVFVVFPGLLKLVGLSKDPDETLQVKIEADTHPPSSFEYGIGMVSDQDQEWIVPNIVKGTDSTLFGGKMHAVLYRQYAKGRDIFDLHWYLRRKTPLNIRIVEETEKSLGKIIHFTRETFLESLLKKINEMDLKAAEKDVLPFVSHPEELSLIFDAPRLCALLKDLRFWRPSTAEEYFESLLKFVGLRKEDSPSLLVSKIKSQYFEIRPLLDNEGVRPAIDEENTLEGILSFLKKQGLR